MTRENHKETNYRQTHTIHVRQVCGPMFKENEPPQFQSNADRNFDLIAGNNLIEI